MTAKTRGDRNLPASLFTPHLIEYPDSRKEATRVQSVDEIKQIRHRYTADENQYSAGRGAETLDFRTVTKRA